MKSVRGMIGKLQRRATGDATASSGQPASVPQVGLDGPPEEVVARAVRQFCESGGPTNSSGDEVILLPTIVESAECSPSAAAEAAHTLRKFLSKDYYSKPTHQYNAIMIIRILADNPGPRFTRHIDKKFVDTTKDLLQRSKDPSVLSLMWETLDTFENEKAQDEGLAPLIEMWKAEKVRGASLGTTGHHPNLAPPTLTVLPNVAAHSQNYWARHHRNKKLPSPVELASRLEEARTSAKLLQQAVACTPPQEVLNNDLIREFADRCQSASRSIQSYMVAEDPAPDNDTMEALIDANEQLQASLNQHQRAVLGARKSLGIGEPNHPPSPNPSNGTSDKQKPSEYGHHTPPPVAGDGVRPAISPNPAGGNSSSSTPPPLPARDNSKGKRSVPTPPPKTSPSGNDPPAPQEENPFKDPTDKRYAFESYQPRFTENSGKQHGTVERDDNDDLYGDPSPKKDPSNTILRY